MAEEIKETKEKEIKQRETVVAQLPEGMDFPPELIVFIIALAGIERRVLPGIEAKSDKGPLKGAELSTLFYGYYKVFLDAYLVALTPQEREKLYWLAFDNDQQNLCLLLIEMSNEEFLNRGFERTYRPIPEYGEVSEEERLQIVEAEETKIERRGQSKLYVAVATGNVLVASALIASGKVKLNRSVDPKFILYPRGENEHDSGGMTPFHLAVLTGNVDPFLPISPEVRATFRDRSRYGHTPLHSAAYKAAIEPAEREVYLRIIAILIAAGADPNHLTLAIFSERAETAIELASTNYIGDDRPGFVKQLSKHLGLPSPQASDAKEAKSAPLISSTTESRSTTPPVSLASAASSQGFMPMPIPPSSSTLSTSNHPTPASIDRKPERTPGRGFILFRSMGCD